MATLDPRFDPLAQAQQGVIPQVNWAADAQGAPVQPVQFGQGQGAPDMASQLAAAQAVQGAMANQQAQAGQLPQDVIDAMTERYALDPKAAKIKKQFATADAIRGMGSDLNTGSTRGGAPNWAGALANIVGAWKGQQMQDEAQTGADALGLRQGEIARKYFGAAPASALFGRRKGDEE